ncbi:MAG: hypothetical protein ABI906_06765 [Pseudomonadota bacterium]
MGKKLKVFAWSDGFHAYTVATTSRAKALAAWGFKRDLFKDGEARQISHGQDFDLALSRPGEIIERGVSVDIGKASRRPPAKPKPSPPKADLARVTRLEASLAALDQEHDREAAILERKRKALEVRRAALSSDFRARRAELAGRLDAARAKLER